MKKSKLIRLISILLVFGFATTNLNAGSEETLEIKAYKNYHESEGFLAVYITDAITSSLKLVAESEGAAVTDIEPIDITPYVENSLLGTVPSSDEAAIVSEENIVFSYRVVGNLSSNYTISFTIDPFVQDTVGDSPYSIAAYYQIMHENAVFQGTSSTESSDSPSWRINLTPSESHGIASDNNSAELSASWNVQYQHRGWFGNYYYEIDSSHSPSSDSWIVRGAVAVLVDRADYEAICKVRVTSNG